MALRTIPHPREGSPTSLRERREREAARSVLIDSDMGAFEIHSPSFHHLGTIPSRYTCEGEDVSPPLAWSGTPSGTRSLVLIVDDPDAPDPAAPRRTWVHWVVYNLPARATKLPENARALPPGASAALNDWNRHDYGGPCPPVGRHRYFFKLFALDTELPFLPNGTKVDLEKAMMGHVLGQAELVGTYAKQNR